MWDTENNMFLTQGYDAEHVVEVGEWVLIPTAPFVPV